MWVWGAAALAFTTRDGDPRRTGQASVAGPRNADTVHTTVLEDGQAVNMPATFDADGRIFVGTWGLLRSFGEENPRRWDKMDGKLFQLDPDGTLAQTWPLDRTPMCYTQGRRWDGACPLGGMVTYHNGTVEGTPTLVDGHLVVGRGDGKVYSVDAATGAIEWTFTAFDPTDPTDEDGGGGVVGGTLVLDGVVYFATVASGEFQTNAVYAVDLATGALRWRYPSAVDSVPGPFRAPLAASPDGTRIYAAEYWTPVSLDSRVLAFDTTGAGTTGEEHLAWEYHAIDRTLDWRPTVGAAALAVGTDGTIYAGGSRWDLGWGMGAVFALHDDGARASLAWPAIVVFPAGDVAHGLALREEAGVTTRIYAATGTTPVLDVYPTNAGVLAALSPADGTALWPHAFDPSAHGGDGGMNDVSIDVDGNLYVSATGLTDHGRVWSLDPDGNVRWAYAAAGLLEAASPVLGPEGQLVFGDTRRCGQRLLPVESGVCGSADPTVYVLPPPDPEDPIPGETGDTGSPSTDTATDTTPDHTGTPPGDTTGPRAVGRPRRGPEGGCGCASTRGASWGLGGCGLAVAALRRRRRR